jgi:hypothetical protein
VPAIDGYAAQGGRVAPAGSAIDPFESLGQEEPKMTFSLRWWEAYLSAPRAAVVGPRSERSFANLISDAGVRVERRRRTAADARVLVRELARQLRPPRLPQAKQRPEAPWIPLTLRVPP